MPPKRRPRRVQPAEVPEDLRIHLAGVDRFLSGARVTGLTISILLLGLARRGLDATVMWYGASALLYIGWRELLLPGRNLPRPTVGQLLSILVEFTLISAFLRLSGQITTHLFLIIALPVVGYAARYGRAALFPIIVGTTFSTFFSLAGRIVNTDWATMAFLVAESVAILWMAHFAGRASQRSFRLAWSLAREARRSRLLLEISQYANRTLAVDQTLRNAAEAIRRLTGHRPAFFIYDAKRDEFQLRVSSVFQPEEAAGMTFSPGNTVFEDLIATRAPVVVPDLATCSRLPQGLRGRIPQNVAVMLPLEHDGELLGTMNLGKANEFEFSPDELDLLSAIARLMGQAVFNARAHEEAEKLSVLDELTGLYNHRYFQAELARQLQLASTEGKSLTVAMVDLDDFKVYNDLFGHMQGDEVLRQVGVLLDSRFPASGERGFAARYGGEEFVFVIPLAGQEARRVCEEIRVAVSDCRFPGSGALEGGHITVSIGIAEFPAQSEERNTLIAAADTALYRAKHLGKNRCEFYTSVLDAIETDVLEESEIGLIKTIKPLVSVINGKDNYTYGHSERVVEHAVTLGQALGLSPVDLRYLSFAAFLHDLGKLEISRELLNKTETLTPEEWRTLQLHPVWGAEMVGGIASLRSITPAIRHHHERWDGKGYPDGLAGEAIPLAARIISVVDAFDAMITARPYRREKTFATALAEILANAGTQFDPAVARAFHSHMEAADRPGSRTA